MQSLDEFKAFYEDELSDVIAQVREDVQQIDGTEVKGRTPSERWKGFLFIGGITFLILAPISLAIGGQCIWGAVALSIFVGIGAWSKEPDRARRTYASATVQERLKETVAKTIVSFFGDDFTLEPTGQIEKEAINESLLFPRRASVAYGEDYVSGTVGETAVEFSEGILSTSPFADVNGAESVDTEKDRRKEEWDKMEQYELSKLAAQGRHFFRGLYFVADFNKHFRGHTVVRPSDTDLDPDARLEAADGRALGRLERVQLEDPEMEELYNVYGTDQQQARYILSTSLIERIKAFRERTGKSIYLAFYRSNMHVAVPYERDLLELREPPSKEELLQGRDLDHSIDRKRVFDYFQDLRFILGIVEEFDLNTRIWLKE